VGPQPLSSWEREAAKALRGGRAFWGDRDTAGAVVVAVIRYDCSVSKRSISPRMEVRSSSRK